VPENKAVVIVTVSGGFIGGAVCRAFVSDDYSVVGFDRPDVLEPQPGVTNTMSRKRTAWLRPSVRSCAISPSRSHPVIHLAAYYDFSSPSASPDSCVRLYGRLR
jgi:nucleoside-diphosphate-sugar epimerase